MVPAEQCLERYTLLARIAPSLIVPYLAGMPQWSLFEGIRWEILQKRVGGCCKGPAQDAPRPGIGPSLNWSFASRLRWIVAARREIWHTPCISIFTTQPTTGKNALAPGKTGVTEAPKQKHHGMFRVFFPLSDSCRDPNQKSPSTATCFPRQVDLFLALVMGSPLFFELQHRARFRW